MGDFEKVHFLTEAIYKNIIDNFNPGARQLMAAGRSLQKALQVVATTSKTYVECLYSLAQSAQVCKGATSEIGAALLQIAEVHKEINTQVIDNIKSFHAELLIPVENKQENEAKQVQMLHKKYGAGHKYHLGIFEKSNNALKKHKKKTKGKYGFDQKEMQYSHDVKEKHNKLDDYQQEHLRVALLEERKRYCFILERICSVVRVHASHHSKAHELLTHRLPEWCSLFRNPHILPESSEQVLMAFRMQQEDVYHNPDEPLHDMDAHQTPSNPDSGGSVHYGSAPLRHQHDSVSMTYGTVNGLHMQQQQQQHHPEPPVGILRPTTPLLGRPQVRAVYSLDGTSETQLNFRAGDIINLVGDKREGWQYGENNATGRFNLGRKRVQSLGNLHDASVLFPDSEYMAPVPMSSGHSDSESMVGVHAPLRERSHTMHSSRPQPTYDTHRQMVDARGNAHLPYPPRPLPPSAALMQPPFAKHLQSSSSRSQASTPPLPPPPPPLQDMPPLPPPPLPPNNRRPSSECPPPLNHTKSSPAILPRTSIPFDPSTMPAYANHYAHSPCSPSPGNSSSGYSGSSNNPNNQGGGYGGSAPHQGFPPPPPPNLAPPPPPTSDYEEDAPRNQFSNVTLKRTRTNDRSAPRV